MAVPESRSEGQPREVAAVIEEQVRGIELKPELSTGSAPPVWPVVAISREFGTHGVVLGYRTAERLGFSFWDREIVTKIARDLNTDEATAERLDESARSRIEQLLGASIFNRRATSTTYVERLRFIIGSICERGGAVIVGHGAQFLVDPTRSLRVRLVAPFDVRVRGVIERLSVPLETARRGVRAGDRRRTEFVRTHFGQEAGSPEHYDLVINTAVYTPQRADLLILMAYLAKFGELPTSAQAKEADRALQRASTLPPEPADGT
ncbi:MAG: cytidylate kinase-like family protein [Polyangiaceae bacterium]|nr:cytidylate kinase-like family protein [Polyangiaceae bacterium]